MIELYEHNQKAYESAVSMLARTGRAAIIHPTGTGKSFIGFKLCEDNPNKTVCWLAPSEYIFHTQIENLDIAGADKPQNICFFTYARLMGMSTEEMMEVRPNIVILDEFHRAGASCWGVAVKKFLNLYPNVPALGLSATSIRYLDGQRDMADELFDGNVASEITLGEAIVRGILNPPKYVLSLYSWKKELERYQERARKAMNKAVRAEAEKYLEALRRALEKADGLDVIFQKYITKQMEENGKSDSFGKYLVFCANYDHMQEMIARVPEWFHKVDHKPHIYSVYSEDAQAQAEFARFKADGSHHLKLLFCIDMLNEGIHVDDVNGVILLRPTISPIIYKQQIGRALSTGKKKRAIIFDVVMNIENLYSIGTIEEEMQTTVQYYKKCGEASYIVNEHFSVTDELQDCMKLFEKLNETLGASWELMYQKAEQYFEKHGNLDVPKRYKTTEGLSLGQWLDTQRKVRAGKVRGILTEEQIQRLDRLKMNWQGRAEANWSRNYDVAKRYYEQHGNLLVAAEEEYGGVKLGRWITRLREEKKSHRGVLTEDHVAALEAIGMVWDVPDYRWELNFHAAQQYYKEFGNLDIPYYYTDKDGIRLGAWVSSMRSVRSKCDHKRAELTENRIRRLDEIGMVWQTSWNRTWERSYEEACRYREEHGDLNIPTAYVTEDGCRLGRWIRHQRDACRGNISEERKQKLERLGI